MEFLRINKSLAQPTPVKFTVPPSLCILGQLFNSTIELAISKTKINLRDYFTFFNLKNNNES